MRKIYSFTKTGMLLLLIFVVVSGCSSNEGGASDAGNEDSTYTFKLTNGVGPQDVNFNAYHVPWMERVTEETDGRVQFEVFHSEELVAMGEEVRALENNTIDIAGQVLPTYHPQQFPLSDVSMLPLVDSDAQIAAKAWHDLLESDVELQDGKTFFDLEYGRYGVKTLSTLPTNEANVGTVGIEVTDADSLEGATIRISSRTQELFVKEIGAGSISMPYTEEYESLSKGALDGNIRSVVEYEPYGFDQYITNVLTGINLGHFPFIWMMSEDKWDSLPSDIQEIMQTAADDLVDTTVKIDDLNDAVAHVEEEGIKITELSDLDSDTQAFFETAAVNTWDSWIEAKEAEDLPGLELAKLWRDLIIEHGGSVPEEIMELE